MLILYSWLALSVVFFLAWWLGGAGRNPPPPPSMKNTRPNPESRKP